MTAPLEVVLAARTAGATIAVAESLTGGAVCSALVSVPGASEVLLGGVVSYTVEAKHRLLGVPRSLLEEIGPVSREVAVAMAVGARETLGADIAVSTMGVAGPDPHDGQAPGTVWVGVATADGATATLHRGSGGRADVRDSAVEWALAALRDRLTKDSHV